MHAFSYSGLTSITILNCVTAIEQWAFSGCSKLMSITVQAITPPAILFNIENQVFQYVPDTIPIYIPCGTYKDYRTANGWDYFYNFIDPERDTNFYSATFPQGGTYSDDNFTALMEAGRYCITLQNSSDCDSVVCLNLTSYTSISEWTPNNGQLTVYPNPTDGQLRIINYELQEIRDIKNYDMLGKKQIPPLKGGRGMLTIDISHLPAGIYILQVKTEKGISTKKIIKE